MTLDRRVATTSAQANNPMETDGRCAPTAHRQGVGQEKRETSMNHPEKSSPPARAVSPEDGDDSEPYFAHSATLRVFGDTVDRQEISARLGVEPTHWHRKGDRRSPGAAPWEHDAWNYTAPIPKDRPLGEHIDALWATIKPKKSYLLALKEVATVDVFLGYRSDSDTAGLDIPHHSLEIFAELQVSLALSIIIA